MSSVRAPAALRERVADERDRTLVRRMVVKRLKLTGVMAGAAATLGVAVALVAPGSAGPEPLTVAALAMRGPAAPAPAVDPAHPKLLKARIGGLSFPSWSPRVPWKAVGQRSDEVGGRSTLTVFYDNPAGVRLGYTIVDGDALDWPDGARKVVRDHVDVRVLHRGGRVIAFWREGGRSCIISAPGSVPDERMILLASSTDYLA
jgi:hypothetical protein